MRMRTDGAADPREFRMSIQYTAIFVKCVHVLMSVNNRYSSMLTSIKMLHKN